MRSILDKSLIALVAIAMVGMLSACGDDDEGTEGGGTHNAGRNCLDCHGWSYAGTVYTDATGATAAPNRAVDITEASGAVVSFLTDANGNFYGNGNPGGGYSSTVRGITTPMVASQTNGGCNAGGCHDGVTQSRIFLN